MLWIVGRIFQGVAEYLSARNIPYGLLASEHSAAEAERLHIPVIRLDFSSPETLRASAQAANLDVTAIVSAGYDNYVLPAAILSEMYGVPGLSVEAAHAATDKAAMRTAFATAPSDISPDFQLVSDWSDIDEFMTDHSFPVMLKPTNLMKSLFITKNESVDQLRHNYDDMSQALHTVAEQYYTMLPPAVLIEECMTGSMHTVAGYADHTGAIHLLSTITDCLTGHDVGKSQNYIYSRQLPSQLDAALQQRLLAVAEAGAISLGLTSCMLHIELMLTADGPKIIEIGARVGGYRTRMHEYIDAINLTDVMIAVAQGEVPPLPTHTTNRSISVIELFADAEGMFDEISNFAKLEALPSLMYLSVKTEHGQKTGRSDQGYKAAAILILGNENREQFEHDQAYVRGNVTVELIQ